MRKTSETVRDHLGNAGQLLALALFEWEHGDFDAAQSNIQAARARMASTERALTHCPDCGTELADRGDGPICGTCEAERVYGE